MRLFWSDLIVIVLRLFLRGVQFFATSRVVSAPPTGASMCIPNLDHILVTEDVVPRPDSRRFL
jgi:hypothetical protein